MGPRGRRFDPGIPHHHTSDRKEVATTESTERKITADQKQSVLEEVSAAMERPCGEAIGTLLKGMMLGLEMAEQTQKAG